MKKTIFGSALMLSGIIGFTGWVNAVATLNAPYCAGYSLLEIFNDWENLFAVGFIILAVVGAWIAISSLKEDK